MSYSAVTKSVLLQGLSQPSPSIVVVEEDFAAVALFGNTALASVASVILAVEISSWQFLVCMCVFIYTFFPLIYRILRGPDI